MTHQLLFYNNKIGKEKYKGKKKKINEERENKNHPIF